MVFVAASVISFAVCAPYELVGYEIWRSVAVTSIFASLGVVCLPVLYKIAGMKPPSETIAADVSLTVICPRCSLSQSLKAGESQCAGCRLKFVIEVEEPRCTKCGYLLYQLTEPRCPECGAPISDADVVPALSST